MEDERKPATDEDTVDLDADEFAGLEAGAGGAGPSAGDLGSGEHGAAGLADLDEEANDR